MSIETNFRASYDAIVVGARCAGAATAMLLARPGLNVLAIDRGRYGADTLSTHALMRAGVLQLQRWGVLEKLRRAETPPVRMTSFHYGDDVVDQIVARCTDVESGARNIDHIVNKTLLPLISTEILQQVGDETEYTRLVLTLSDDHQFVPTFE